MESWKRNLYIMWVAEFIAIIGFGVILPFLPYFIQELGVTDEAQVKLYAGLALALSPLTMALVSPVWGVLADRFGRKVMVERAMFGGAILFFANGFVENVHVFLILRALQGCFSGTIAAANTLVAGSAPREHAGYAQGTLLVSVYLGMLLGPTIGGVVGDLWGYRAAFFVTSALLALAGILVFWVEEHFAPMARERAPGGFQRDLRLILGMAPLVTIFGLRVISLLGDRILTPLLPLLVQQLLPSGAKAAFTTGVILGASGLTSAIGAIVLGRASDRFGARSVLLFCSFASVGLYTFQFFVTDTTQLLLGQALVGFVLGGTLTALSAMLAKLSPEGRQGVVYGIDASAIAIAKFLGPLMGAGVAIGFGLPPGFLVCGGLLCADGSPGRAILAGTSRASGNSRAARANERTCSRWIEMMRMPRPGLPTLPSLAHHTRVG
jgi:DHA1 family multidrug resistance protein-like MFS transporter